MLNIRAENLFMTYCMLQGCTQQRLTDIVNAPYSGLGGDAGDFVSPVTEALRQRMQGRYALHPHAAWSAVPVSVWVGSNHAGRCHA